MKRNKICKNEKRKPKNFNNRSKEKETNFKISIIKKIIRNSQFLSADNIKTEIIIEKLNDSRIIKNLKMFMIKFKGANINCFDEN